MKALNRIERRFWEAYLATLPKDDAARDAYVEANYAGSRDITDELLALYLNGKKHAGSSVVEDFLSAGDPLPKVGNHWVFLDSHDVPRCILRTESVQLHKFRDIPDEIAIAEGEGDLSLAHWKKAHEKAYGPYLAQWGLSAIDEATIITEFFKIVHRCG